MTIFDVSADPSRIPFPLVLRAIVDLSVAAGVRVIVVGATARDIACAAAGLDRPSRATNDVDIAVAVSSMEEFAAVVVDLTPASPPSPHKFVIAGVDVDIVPFGGIERPDRTIAWPDGTRMDVVGMSEAFAHALVVRLDEDHSIAVASIPAQAALKLHAWRDRRSWTTRDAVDLSLLLRSYSEGGRLDDVYAERHSELLESYDYAPRLVGAHLLGGAVALDMGRDVAARCRAIVVEGSERLAADMPGDVDENRAALQAFLTGVDASGS